MQSINDSIDELKSRVDKLQQTVKDLQAQIQTLQAPAPTTQPGAGQPGQPRRNSQPGTQARDGGKCSSRGSPAAGDLSGRPARLQRRKVRRGDRRVPGRVHYYPLDDLAGTAQFYLGEIAYQQKDYADAINAYNAVLEGFSGNAKAPAAQLHKGLALLAMDKKDAGIHELRRVDPAASADAGGTRRREAS